MKKIKFEDLPSENTPITSANLNNMQNNIEESAVIVSSTEPQTKEKVWFQKGKNLFNKNSGVVKGYNIDSSGNIGPVSDLFYTENYMPANPNNAYTISSKYSAIYRIAEYDKDYKFIKRQFNPGASTKYTITTAVNTKYIRISCDINGIDSIQLEEGSQATLYEPYIEKKILTKNLNGVFEEFYNEEDIKTEVITNEKGTAIKYADGQMICYGSKVLTISCGSAWGNLFYGISKEKIFFPSSFINIPVISTLPYPTTATGGIFASPGSFKVSNERFENIGIVRATASDVEVNVNYIAIGRWK